MGAQKSNALKVLSVWMYQLLVLVQCVDLVLRGIQETRQSAMASLPMSLISIIIIMYASTQILMNALRMLHFVNKFVQILMAVTSAHVWTVLS